MIQPAIRKTLLLLALGLGLICFGAIRLHSGTTGTLETVALVACIASGLCFLSSLLLVLRKAVRARTSTN